jgi:hypothetical protein
MSLEESPKLHAKFLLWDKNNLAVTSFNWMAAIVDGARPRGAEIGILLRGSDLRAMLDRKFSLAPAGAISLEDVTLDGQLALELAQRTESSH